MIKLFKNVELGDKKMYRLNRDKLLEHINSTWQTKTCPMCGRNDWAVGDSIVTSVNINEEKGIQLGGRFQPMTTVTCNHCGNVVFINVMVAKAVDEEEK